MPKVIIFGPFSGSKSHSTSSFRKLNLHLSTGWSDGLGLRNRAAVSLFLDLWATQRHPSDHKIGSKWHLGQKYFLVRLKISLKGGKEKEDTEDLRIWVWYSGCPEMDSCFNPPLLTPNHFKFCPSRLLKCRNLRKC